MKRYILRVTIILIFFINICNYCYAESFFTTARTWLDGAEIMAEKTEIDNTATGEIVGILATAGTGIAVIAGAILGIKYMISSVEEKAKVKERLIWYIIAVVIIFGAIGIWTAIVNTLDTAVTVAPTDPTI